MSVRSAVRYASQKRIRATIVLATSSAVLAAGSPAPAQSGSPDPLTRSGVLWQANKPGIPAPPAPPARSWILVDARSGKVYAAANARSRQFPASTLKTLTAVTLLPRLNLSEVYTATSSDVGIHGSGAGLVVGGTYTIEQLFLGMLLPSGNDAATALTHAYHRDSRRAIRLMNRTARALGTTGTTARNPHGLPDPRQVTTAADMAIIARAAVSNPTFRRLAKMRVIDFPGRMPAAGKQRQTYQLQNENPFIRRGVSGTIGGKTGYTRASLRTFWVAVKRGNRTLLLVMLGFVGSYRTLAQHLLDWGFKYDDSLAGMATLPPVPPPATLSALTSTGPTSPTAHATTRPSATPMPAALAHQRGGDSDLPRRTASLMLLLIPAFILARRAVRVRRTERQMSIR